MHFNNFKSDVVKWSGPADQEERKRR